MVILGVSILVCEASGRYRLGTLSCKIAPHLDNVVRNHA